MVTDPHHGLSNLNSLSFISGRHYVLFCAQPAGDLVAVLNVDGAMSSAKFWLMKSSMRVMISSLGSTNLLSIIVFFAESKRLLSLRRGSHMEAMVGFT